MLCHILNTFFCFSQPIMLALAPALYRPLPLYTRDLPSSLNLVSSATGSRSFRSTSSVKRRRRRTQRGRGRGPAKASPVQYLDKAEHGYSVTFYPPSNLLLFLSSNKEKPCRKGLRISSYANSMQEPGSAHLLSILAPNSSSTTGICRSSSAACCLTSIQFLQPTPPTSS